LTSPNDRQTDRQAGRPTDRLTAIPNIQSLNGASNNNDTFAII